MVRGEQNSPAPHATDVTRDAEPDRADSAEVIRLPGRRSSGEESS
jgi:hypothetical protein